MIFIWAELDPLVSKVPFSVKQSWKSVTGDPGEVKAKQRQLFHSVVKLVQHSPLVHVWGVHMAMGRGGQCRASRHTCCSQSPQRARVLREKQSSSGPEFVYFGFPALAVVMPILANALLPGMTIRQAHSHVTTLGMRLLASPFPQDLGEQTWRVLIAAPRKSCVSCAPMLSSRPFSFPVTNYLAAAVVSVLFN